MTLALGPSRPAHTRERDGVVIVGGGASGALTALHLLRADPTIGVTVVEPSGRVGVGIAYGTTDARHLLNVRAGNMSAFPDDPGDLLAWAQETGRDLAAADFLPRRSYADYLADRLAAVAGDRLAVRATAVTDVEPVAGGFRVVGADGTSTHAPTVVLAHGNDAPPPLAVGGVQLSAARWHVEDPWRPRWCDRLGPEATVVLVGSGLTAIDTAISVLDAAPRRRVVMVSRHGLLPRPHIECQCVAWVSPIPPGRLTADQVAGIFCDQVEAAAAHGVSWQHVVDGLRGPTQSIWARLAPAERERFLSVYAREWEVRRHRMAPAIAARLEELQAQGRLQVLSGGLTAVEDGGSYAVVAAAGARLRAHAVVNCTGPRTDVTRSDNPLLAALLRRGLAAPDDLRLGLACTPAGELLDAADRVVPGLLTVGPPRKGALYETTAIPEIRVQAAEVAARLAQPRILAEA